MEERRVEREMKRAKNVFHACYSIGKDKCQSDVLSTATVLTTNFWHVAQSSDIIVLVQHAVFSVRGK